jgi:hypothetical protein
LNFGDLLDVVAAANGNGRASDFPHSIGDENQRFGKTARVKGTRSVRQVVRHSHQLGLPGASRKTLLETV